MIAKNCLVFSHKGIQRIVGGIVAFMLELACGASSAGLPPHSNEKALTKGEITMGNGEVCVLKPNRELDCWGWVPSLPYEGVAKQVVFVAGGRCIRSIEGEIHCPDELRGKVKGRFSSIASDMLWTFCGVQSGHLLCFGYGGEIKSTDALKNHWVREVIFDQRGAMVCVVVGTELSCGKIAGLAGLSTDKLTLLPLVGPFKKIKVLSEQVCTLSGTTLKCWDKKRGAYEVAKNITDFILEPELCVVETNGQAYCPLTGEKLSEGVHSIVGNGGAYCMLKDDDSVLCKGEGEEQRWVHVKKWLHVSGACFLSEDHVKQCMTFENDLWEFELTMRQSCSFDSLGVWSCGHGPKPEGLHSVIEELGYTCGVNDRGKIVCEGLYSITEDEDVVVTSLDGDGRYFCGLLPDKMPICWEGGLKPLSAPPSVPLVQLSVHDGVACGVSISGVAVCWGDESFERSATPDGQHFKRIKLLRNNEGNIHWCGLTDNLALRCSFSLNSWEKKLRFRSFSMTKVGACGITTEYDAYCLGSKLATGTVFRRWSLK